MLYSKLYFKRPKSVIYKKNLMFEQLKNKVLVNSIFSWAVNRVPLLAIILSALSITSWFLVSSLLTSFSSMISSWASLVKVTFNEIDTLLFQSNQNTYTGGPRIARILGSQRIVLIGDWFSTKIVKLANSISKVPFFTQITVFF